MYCLTMSEGLVSDINCLKVFDFILLYNINSNKVRIVLVLIFFDNMNKNWKEFSPDVTFRGFHSRKPTLYWSVFKSFPSFLFLHLYIFHVNTPNLGVPNKCPYIILAYIFP